MNYHLYIGGLCLLLASCTVSSPKKGDTGKDYTSYVNPLIGSGGHGHVFVGASLPHGMVQLGPNNLSQGWDWCSGYHDSDSTIIGFAHTHLSGTGIADLGDVLFMPVTGNVDLRRKSERISATYFSTFKKENEQARPGYYAVLLDKYDVKAELTATPRVGFHKYSYPSDEESAVIINLNESAQSLMFREGTLSSGLRLLNDSTVAGYRISNEWATDHRVYFTTVFSEPILSCDSIRENTGLVTTLNFGKLASSLLVKTGISYVSEEGAMRNLEAELPGWDFDGTSLQAKTQWNEALSKIDVVCDDHTKAIFYTAFYHTMIVPSLFSDVDGMYRGADGKIHHSTGFTPYTIFSLWDTYRAVHPLYTLVDNNVPDYVNTLLDIYDRQGTLPVWHLAGNETNCMVGVHSIPVVVDACLKDFQGIDKERAYRAVSSIRSMNQNGLDHVREKGYIPADKVNWSVARALEYAIDDYAVAQLARELHYTDDCQYFLKRSKLYQEYFDGTSGFMRGKLSDGSWRTPFNPSHSIHLEDDYVEGNAWQYTWLVPHDVEGLIDLFGGQELFLNKLDSLFMVSSELNEGASIDISGMIGQYAHGNEPSHHTLYLYALAGRRWRTAELVRQVFEEFYTNTPDGLIGNEDCGQMSAWYIFSSLGFYPVNPVNGTFVFGSPLINRATIHLNNGKTLEIIANENSQKNKYIQSVKLNGKTYSHPYMSYKDLMDGGVLEYQMGENPY
ncbi:GH92 family glycosyl hydrolase [Bacteroides sp. 51]|uniref:GH92 family glycosyl hydrolase n=1 Tax=Bacteroides sp. 51 TaxID=2302938 RepID=UPI001EF186CF|nr:GH92 family glycosyl hydrolase [Bacteroides sp. 51]